MTPARRRARSLALVVAAWLTTAIVVHGQAADSQGAGELQGALPDAAFSATFRKFLSSDSLFSPFYSWDAAMSLDVTAYRAGSQALAFEATFQSVGTENLGATVSVGGTGYILGLSYRQRRSEHLAVAAGFRHLSSHLTRDLDAKIREVRGGGGTIPTVEDPSEFNVLYAGATAAWPDVRFTPAIEVLLEPVYFKFNGGDTGNARPLYIRSDWVLWHASRARLIAETENEFGPGPFGVYTLRVELAGSDRYPPRLHLFATGSPGSGLHVSPNIGGIRDGLALGFALTFRT